MNTNYSPRVRSLLRQADRVNANGKRAAAAQLYRELLAEAPEVAEGWYGLAQVATDPDERATALEKGRALNPELEFAAKETPAVVPPAESIEQTTVAEPAAPIITPLETIKSETAEDDYAGEAACKNHNDRMTGLRCNRCGEPICSACTRKTPVGYRCPQCILEIEEKYFTASTVDLVVATIVALVISLAAGFALRFIGFWILLIFLSPAVGGVIATIASAAIGKRRGRYIPHAVAVCVGLGAVFSLLMGAGLFSSGIFLALAPSAAFYRLR